MQRELGQYFLRSGRASDGESSHQKGELSSELYSDRENFSTYLVASVHLEDVLSGNYAVDRSLEAVLADEAFLQHD